MTCVDLTLFKFIDAIALLRVLANGDINKLLFNQTAKHFMFMFMFNLLKLHISSKLNFVFQHPYNTRAPKTHVLISIDSEHSIECPKIMRLLHKHAGVRTYLKWPLQWEKYWNGKNTLYHLTSFKFTDIWLKSWSFEMVLWQFMKRWKKKR